MDTKNYILNAVPQQLPTNEELFQRAFAMSILAVEMKRTVKKMTYWANAVGTGRYPRRPKKRNKNWKTTLMCKASCSYAYALKLSATAQELMAKNTQLSK